MRDRDHLERVEERAPTPSDLELDRAWRAGLADPALLGTTVPIVDRLGRPGLEARPGAAALAREGLDAILAAADALDEPAVASILTVAMPPEGPRVRLWWRVPVPDRPRVWRGQAPPTPV